MGDVERCAADACPGAQAPDDAAGASAAGDCTNHCGICVCSRGDGSAGGFVTARANCMVGISVAQAGAPASMACWPSQLAGGIVYKASPSWSDQPDHWAVTCTPALAMPGAGAAEISADAMAGASAAEGATCGVGCGGQVSRNVSKCARGLVSHTEGSDALDINDARAPDRAGKLQEGVPPPPLRRHGAGGCAGCGG